MKPSYRNKMFLRFIFQSILFLLFVCCDQMMAQQSIKVGKGSYAEYTPLYKSKTSEHAGDKSRYMETKELFINQAGRPIPTNDWWTDLLNDRYSGNLWSYPQVVNAEEYGIYIAYPTFWSNDGCEMKWNSQLEVSGIKFKPESAIAEDWNDWGVEMKMVDKEKEMHVTLAHGNPFTYIETDNMVPQIKCKSATFYTSGGEETQFPVVTERLLILMGEDAYGIYVPDKTRFEYNDGMLSVLFDESSKQFMSVAVLPQKTDLDDFAQYAYNIPRSTSVDWKYDEVTGKVISNWRIVAENILETKECDVLQGFIPHHYKRSEMDFGFTNYKYATPRGEMKLAIGNSFSIVYDFNGMLPYYAAPKELMDMRNPYQSERMKQLIEDYADKGGFGADTYWGGKGLTQMALYMTFAYETGEIELFEKCKTRLKDALVNWLTYTPGENNFFFARYQRWRALVGYDTSYDSDTFNDHHFHYGYFTYAGALLALFDDDFKNNYGDMLTLVAKDYANWDKTDLDFPFFRTFDPWAGHSYAGGLGGWNGNGQESTSEAMQGWGGLYLLGIATGNKEMRDAGIFGWTTESRGVAEYWFDRDKENINRSLYTKPYNSNLTSQGIGWWTWFSGDPVWMHSIQWMPISPCLKYLSENLEFARWDYTQMWNGKEIGGWNEVQNGSSLGDESGLGNVVLSYLQRFDPDSAAVVFDTAWEGNKNLAKNPDTGGISYFITHSHRTYGDIDWNIHANVPSATTYKNKVTGDYTYMVYNPDREEKLIKFYRGNELMKEFKAGGRRLTAYNDAPVAKAIKIIRPKSLVVPPGETLQLKAKIEDQYGVNMEGTPVWLTEGEGTVTSDGLFTAGNTKETVCRLTVKSGELSDNLDLIINDKAVLSDAVIVPDIPYLETGNLAEFSLQANDQYGNSFPVEVSWKIVKDGMTVKSDSILDMKEIGIYTIKAIVNDTEYSRQVYVTPKFNNIALNKLVYSSSEENVGTLTKYANDGDVSTRWGSAHEDPQWIYIDLDQKAYVSYVNILWEDAYASLYDIQISDNAEEWTTVKHVNGTGGKEKIEINHTTRYIRMYGISRALNYGYSLYEFEVYGVEDKDGASLLGIEIKPDEPMIKEGTSIQLNAKGYTLLGDQVFVTPQWSIISGVGSISEDGLLTPMKYGELTVGASTEGLTSKATYYVEESLKLEKLSISPKNVSLIKGLSQIFTTSGTDQFGSNFDTAQMTYSSPEEGANLQGDTFYADRTGTFMVIAKWGGIADTATVVVSDLESTNLALFKPVSASSYENDGTLPSGINDGDLSTRWGSAFNDGEYVIIDLENDFVIDRVNLYWDEAYAITYRIETSLDGENWDTAYLQTEDHAREQHLLFTPQAARYIKVICLTRKTQYGSSIHELEVYGTNFYQSPVAARMDVNPDHAITYLGENIQFNVKLFDQYGLEFIPQQDFEWMFSGGGRMEDGAFVPETIGMYILTIKYGSLQKEIEIEIRDVRVAEKVVITPNYKEIAVDEILTLESTVYDQFGNMMELGIEPEWSANGGTISQQGSFFSPVPGIFKINVNVAGLKAESQVKVIVADKLNIALGKPTETSTGNGAQAVDGNEGTRWESVHQEGPEWLMVDLKDAYHLTGTEIMWETASAEDYEIQVSKDGINWEMLYQETGLEGARVDKCQLDGIGRYVRVWCTKRSTDYGYSIYEFRLYGRLIEADSPYIIEFINPVTSLSVGEERNFEVKVFDKNRNDISSCEVNWLLSGGGIISQDGLLTAMTSGNYELMATCGLARALMGIQIVRPTGNKMIEEMEELKLWVSNQNLHIESESLSEVSIYTLQGNCIYQAFDIKDHIDIMIPDSEKLYIVRLKQRNGKIETRKIISH